MLKLRALRLRTKCNADGFGTLDILLVLVILSLVGFIGVYVYKRPTTHQPAKSSAAAHASSSQNSKSGSPPADILSVKDTHWSGYVAALAANNNLYNYVQGEFTIPPSFVCTEPGAGVAVWVGIDGTYGDDVTSTVEQDGLQIICPDPLPARPAISYNMFAVLFGTTEPYQYAPLKVRPGDKIFVSVRYANEQFYFVIKDITSGALPYTVHYPCGGSCRRLGAEWIVENNGYNILGKFSPVTFSDAYASTDHGKLESVSALQPDQYTLVAGGDNVNPYSQPVLDRISSLNSSGNGFTVTWLRSK